VPEMLQVERFSSWRDDSEARSGGSKERLRKVLGRERDTTRLCGEHVTPCHEHGVEAVGSHDGSPGDGAAGSSDSSAFPSGDSAAHGRTVVSSTTTNATAAATNDPLAILRPLLIVVKRLDQSRPEKGDDGFFFLASTESGRHGGELTAWTALSCLLATGKKVAAETCDGR
jgi:hypothetical protein